MADEGLNEAEAAVLKTSFDQFVLGQEEIRKSMNEVKVMLLQLLKAKISTPLWIAELSDMVDEVRDRTILVKINSQMHPINDLVIYHVFSEIGTVEDVRYLPTESGFHSRIRFRIKQSSDWAFHYYNGRRLHQGCCELEIHRANDFINWNLQRIANLEAACVGVDAPAITNDDCLLAASLKNDKVLKYIEESTEIDIKDEQIDTKKPSDLVACKVLDEMPDNHECKLFDEMSKSDKVLSQTEESFKVEKLLSIEVDEHKDEVPPVNFKGDQDDLKVSVIVDASIGEDITTGHARGVCFDPGGPKSLRALNHGEEVVQIEINDEPAVAKGSIDLVAYQVFDEMPMPFDKGIESLNAFPNKFKVLVDDTLDQEAPPLSFEEQDDLNVCEIVDSSVDEDTSNGHVRVICFDPGGGTSSLVEDSFILEDVVRELRYCDNELSGMPNLRNRLSSIGINQLELLASEHGEAKVSCGYLLVPTLSCKPMPKVGDALNQEDDTDEVQLLDELAVINGVVTVLADNIEIQHSVYIGKFKQGVEGYLENPRFEFYNSGFLIFYPGGRLLSHELVVSWFLVEMDKTYLCAHAAFDEITASIINLELLLGHYFGVADRAIDLRSHVLQLLESISPFKESRASLMGLDDHIWNAVAESEMGQMSWSGAQQRLKGNMSGFADEIVAAYGAFCLPSTIFVFDPGTSTQNLLIWLSIQVIIFRVGGCLEAVKLMKGSSIVLVFDPGGQMSKAPDQAQNGMCLNCWNLQIVFFLIFEDKDLFKQGGMIQE